MNLTKVRQVLDCASPLALSEVVEAFPSGRGLSHSKTLPRRQPRKPTTVQGSMPSSIRCLRFLPCEISSAERP
jgi:hypothetical protein